LKKINYKTFNSIISITFLSSIVSTLFSIYILRLHIGEMGIEIRGKFVSIIVELGVITAFIKFGTSQSIMYYLKTTEKVKLWTNFIAILLIQSFFLLLICILIFLLDLGVFFNDLSLYLFSTLIISTFIYDSISWFIFLSKNIKIYFFQTMIYVLTYFFALNFILKYSKLDLEFAFFALIFAQISSTMYLFISSSIFNFKMIDKIFIKKIFSNGFKNLGWSYLKDMLYKIDIIIFSRILDVKEFGYYTIIQNLSQFVWKFTDPLVSAYSKYVIKFDLNAISIFYNRILKSFFIFFLLFIIPITLLFANQIFNIISGENLNDYRNMIIMYILTFIFFLIWKLTAQTFVILNSVKNIYYSLFIFFITLSISFIFTNEEFYYFPIIISFIATTIFLTISFYIYIHEKKTIKN
jgi:O-antigen/teichoic acid export membrane protein